VAIAARVDTSAAVPGPCAAEPPSGDVEMTISSGGLQRSAILHVPPVAHRGERLPLVVALHGAGGTGERMEQYSGLDVVADGDDFAVVYPNAVAPHPFWNYTGTTDLEFIRALVQTVKQQICVRARKVYATGISNGGSMAARLGCAMSDTFAAVAPVAGSYARQPPCAPDRAVSVLEIHGTVDASVPYSTALPWVRGWVARDGCAKTAKATALDPATRRFDWSGCAGGARVAHIRIRGGVHQWPGGSPSTASTISAEWDVWRFFRGLKLAPVSSPRTAGRASL
jgi:polyhydroxybutyrate depolymerase